MFGCHLQGLCKPTIKNTEITESHHFTMFQKIRFGKQLKQQFSQIIGILATDLKDFHKQDQTTLGQESFTCFGTFICKKTII